MQYVLLSEILTVTVGPSSWPGYITFEKTFPDPLLREQSYGCQLSGRQVGKQGWGAGLSIHSVHGHFIT